MKRAFLAIILTAGIAASPQPKPDAMLAAGQGHSIVLGPDGSLLTWGENQDGQLGDGTRLTRSAPSPLNGLRGFAAVAAGGSHTLALKGGVVWTWGDNRRGQLGVPEVEGALVPVPLMDLTDVVAISAGETHSIAVRKDGKLWTWGDDRWGQLGVRAQPSPSVPSRMLGLTEVRVASAGGRHSLALLSDASVWGWGSNAEGQIGEAGGIERVPPTRVGGLPGATAIAAGGRHSLAISVEGQVWSWGSNQYGQLGDAWSSARATPGVVGGLSEVKAISAGGGHSLALRQDGSVWSWGDNRAGQLGDPSRTESSVPLYVSGLPEIIAIAAGATHSIAIAKDGTIWTWGGGTEGELEEAARPRQIRPQDEPPPDIGKANVATPTYNPVAGTYSPGNPTPDRLNVTVSCSTAGATIYYTTDGVDPSQTYPPPNGQTIASGSSVSLFQSLTLKAKAFKAGSNPSGINTGIYTLKVGIPGITPAAGTYLTPQTVTLSTVTPGADIRYTTNGTDPTTSSTLYTAPFQVTLTSTVKAKGFKAVWTASDTATAAYTINYGSVSAGLLHSIALTPGGVVWAWGKNTQGQVGIGSVVSPQVSPVQVTAINSVKAIAGGGGHTLVLKTNGEVWGWGENGQGQLGDKSFTTPRLAPVKAIFGNGGGTLMAAIATGENHGLALTPAGAVWTWGLNTFGQLGRNGTTTTNTPAAISGLSNIIAIAAGRNHSFALRNDGALFAWGKNNVGQVGTGSCCANQLTPVQAAGTLGFIVGVTGGFEHSLAIKSDGTVWGWGSNVSGQLGNNTSGTPPQLGPVQATALGSVASIAAGTSHSLALKTDGTAWAWGADDRGQLGNQSVTSSLVPVQTDTLTGIVAIAAGDIHNLAIDATGRVWAWGGNSFGQIGDWTTLDRLTPVSISDSAFAWKVATPVLSPATGTFTAAINVYVTCPTSAATMWYTLDGSEPSPTNGQLVPQFGAIYPPVGTSPLKVKAFKSGMADSNTAIGIYTFNFVTPAPTFSPGPGAYPTTQSVQIRSATSGVVNICYTTNGVDPTECDPPGPNPTYVSVGTALTLKAKAWKSGWQPSPITTGAYTMKVGTPSFSPPPDTYGTAQTVHITSATPNAVIRYTTTGVEPTITDPQVPGNGNVSVEEGMTLKAKGWFGTYVPSDIARGTYFITAGTVAMPTIAPPEGTYTAVQTVTLASPTQGATIRYTLDGSDPIWNSRVYSAPFSVAASTTVKAMAFKASSTPSGIASAAYVIDLGTVATPSLSLDTGSYTTRRDVTVTCATADADIHYTTNGTDPTQSDTPISSGGQVAVAQSLRLKVKAWKNGLPPSGVRLADYTITGAIAAGAHHTLALKPDGTVWAWGSNTSGQLGDGTDSQRNSPVQVLTGIVAIAAGYEHSLAITSTGTLLAWGENGSGQLGNNSTNDSWSPVPVGGGLTSVVAIAGGNGCSFAIKSNGTLWVWGGYTIGQSLLPTAFPGLTGVTRFVGGRSGGYALKTDGAPSGRVWAWGINNRGQLGDGTTTNQLFAAVSGLPQATSIGAGLEYAIAARQDSTLWGWGNDADGQLGDGGSAPPNGSLDRLSPVRAAITGTTSIAAGDYHSLAVRPDGSLWVWGGNGNYQLGNGTNVEKVLPGPNPFITAVAAVAAGASHSVALKVDGSVWAWGDNNAGQVGNGTSSNYCHTPYQVFGPGTNWLTSDPDLDGLPTWMELQLGTDPLNPDTNGDGILDGAAVAMGISPTNMDMDGDGLSNPNEQAIGTDPFLSDTDGDGFSDSQDAFPLDPTRWQPPPPVQGDVTPPIITLTEPTNAVLISSVP
jgi:alpha-tubulin suppressor-like RCC1 family protein